MRIAHRHHRHGGHIDSAAPPAKDCCALADLNTGGLTITYRAQARLVLSRGGPFDSTHRSNEDNIAIYATPDRYTPGG